MSSAPVIKDAASGASWRLGIARLCAAVALFACLDAIAKYLATTLPVLEIAWARFMSNCLFMLLLFMPRMGRGLWRTRRLGIHMARGALLAACMFLFVTALVFLPLAEASALGFVAPIMVAGMSGPLLGERVGTAVWIAIAVGFFGVLVVLRPGGDAFHWAALLPLAMAAGYSLYQILTRKISGTEHSLTSLFYASVVGAVGFSLVLPWVWRTPPDLATAALLAVTGVLGGAGHFLVIKAFEVAPPSLLGPFSYTQIVWAIALGYVVFGDFPDAVTLIGMAIIVGAALFVAWSQRHET